MNCLALPWHVVMEFVQGSSPSVYLEPATLFTAVATAGSVWDAPSSSMYQAPTPIGKARFSLPPGRAEASSLSLLSSVSRWRLPLSPVSSGSLPTRDPEKVRRSCQHSEIPRMIKDNLHTHCTRSVGHTVPFSIPVFLFCRSSGNEPSYLWRMHCCLESLRAKDIDQDYTSSTGQSLVGLVSAVLLRSRWTCR